MASSYEEARKELSLAQREFAAMPRNLPWQEKKAISRRFAEAKAEVDRLSPAVTTRAGGGATESTVAAGAGKPAPQVSTKAVTFDELREAYLVAESSEAQRLAGQALERHPDFRVSMWSDLDTQRMDRIVSAKLGSTPPAPPKKPPSTLAPGAGEPAPKRGKKIPPATAHPGLPTYDEFTDLDTQVKSARKEARKLWKQVEGIDKVADADLYDDLMDQFTLADHHATNLSKQLSVYYDALNSAGLEPSDLRPVTVLEGSAARARIEYTGDAYRWKGDIPIRTDVKRDKVPRGTSSLPDDVGTVIDDAVEAATDDMTVLTARVRAAQMEAERVHAWAREQTMLPVDEIKAADKAVQDAWGNWYAASDNAKAAKVAAAKAASAPAMDVSDGGKFKWMESGYEKYVRPQLRLRTAGVLAGVGAAAYYLHQRKRDKVHDDVMSRQEYEDAGAYGRYKAELREPITLMAPSRKMNPLVTAELTANMHDMRTGHHNMAPDRYNHLFGG